MTTVLLDQIIDTDYGQFTLVWGDDFWDGDFNRFFAGQKNGWVAAAVPGVLHLVMGRPWGGSSVRVEYSDEEPATDPSYEDCVEVSVDIPEGAAVRWETWGGDHKGTLDIVPGSYRVRVSSRGRDEGTGNPEGVVVDFYLLQFWPAEWAPDSVVRVGSKSAAYWNSAWGNRR